MNFALPFGSVRRFQVPYGWLIILAILGLSLCLVVTLFLGHGENGKWYPDTHHVDKPDNTLSGPIVTATDSYISGDAKLMRNGIVVDDASAQVGDLVRYVSYSSIPVDVTVTGQDGHYLFTFSKLMPSQDFYFGYEEPCTITAAAS